MNDLKSLTLGRRIQALRKEQALTQDALAEQMNVTPQAVSKWENDLSCPDIMSLPQLAKVLHVTVDALLTGESAASDAPAAPAKKPEELIVRLAFHAEDGTRICLNLPFTVFRLGVLYDMITFTVQTNEGEQDAEHITRTLAGVDFKHIVRLIESGVTGTLVDINLGDRLTIWTE